MKRLFAIVSGGILCQAISMNCLAQGNGIKLDGSTTPDNSPATLSADSNGVINIDASIGKGVGGNLFHSFEAFNVDSGQTAEFTDLNNAGNPVYDNVIARISGNNASEIFGGIKTGAGLDNANLFLINPNGILFGQGASVSIGGAFYASTADSLVFSDAVNSELTMDAGDLHFSSAPIAAFGFTNVSDKTAVSIQNTSLDFNNDIGIYADNIQIGNGTDASSVNVNNGNTTLVAAATGGSYALADRPTLSDTRAGQIAFDKASLSVNGDNNIVLRGGKLTLANDSKLILTNSGALSDTSQTAIDIQTTANLDLNQSLINSTTANGVSGDIRINSDKINISNGGLIASGVTSKSRGNISTGNIDINANRIRIIGNTLNQANADSANIVPNTTGITAMAAISLDRSTGSINIVANDIYMAQNGSISSTNYGSNPGDIVISEASAKGRLRMESGAKISFSALGSPKGLASGADIDIRFSQVSLTGADTYTGGDAAVRLSPSATTIENLSSRNVENGGDIHISADNFSLSNSASIQGKSSQDGLGANIDIDAKSIFIAGVDANYQAYYHNRNSDTDVGAGISVDHTASNSAGNLPNGSINLRADSIEIGDKGYIYVKDQNIGGYSASGNISLLGKTIRISDAKISSSNYQFNYDAPSSNIDVIASESLYISNSEISTNITSPNGDSGNINLSASQVAIFKSQINTSADIGNGGNINISGKFGIISADTDINAHSNQSIDGIISISNNIQFESRSALTIGSRKSETIVLSDFCSSDNNEQSSLTVTSNNRPLRMENVDLLTTNISEVLNYGLANINDCMHPSVKVSLL